MISALYKVYFVQVLAILQVDLLCKIGRGQPPDYILRKAKNTSKFFKFIGSINHDDRDQSQRNNYSMYQVLTEEEFAAVSAF